MNALAQAIARLVACEAEIKAQISELLAAGRYSEIREVAALAARVAALVQSDDSGSLGFGGGTSATSPAVPQFARTQSSATSEANRAKSQRKRAKDYPRFERHGERLVKLGWSKKDRTEYEHKAPRAAVEAVLAAIETAAGDSAYVRIEDVLKLPRVGEDEVPSYQVYLVMAWLREMGVIERIGNEGYRLLGTDLDFASLWDLTTDRR